MQIINIFKNNDENIIFKWTLLISVIFHIVFILMSGVFLKSNNRDTGKPMEVSYVKIKSQRVNRISKSEDIFKKNINELPAHKDILLLSPKNYVSTENFVKKETIEKVSLKSSTGAEVLKYDFSSLITSADVAGPIDIGVPMDKKALAGYFQMLRRKIKEELDSYPKQDIKSEGIVRVSFTLLKDGRLIDANVYSSSGVLLLDNISVSAVKRASPFSQFPKELNKPSATFYVSISFEKKQ